MGISNRTSSGPIPTDQNYGQSDRFATSTGSETGQTGTTRSRSGLAELRAAGAFIQGTDHGTSTVTGGQSDPTLRLSESQNRRATEDEDDTVPSPGNGPGPEDGGRSHTIRDDGDARSLGDPFGPAPVWDVTNFLRPSEDGSFMCPAPGCPGHCSSRVPNPTNDDSGSQATPTRNGTGAAQSNGQDEPRTTQTDVEPESDDDEDAASAHSEDEQGPHADD